MCASTKIPKEIVPAHLGFLAIYNPLLGIADESVHNQIIYYYTSHTLEDDESPEATDKQSKENDNLKQQTDEQLRQIGLAQGIIEFGKNFSGGKPVKTIETEKSRIILHEIEPSWWILASINLTILPCKSGTNTHPEQEESIEYCSRDVKPAELLETDLIRAHSTFLLHHSSSIGKLFIETKRSKFQRILSRYWDAYITRWNVLLHGNPANNLYLGIKIASCGELGIGVGEEHRGSAEREVLEGFTHQFKGMVDVFVSKFGDDKDLETSNNIFDRDYTYRNWIGNGNELSAEDGAIFLGTGYLSRKSIRDISYWIEDLYRWGIHTYGIIDDPTSSSRSRNSRKERHSGRKLISSEIHREVRDINRQKKKIKNLGLVGQAEPIQGLLELPSTVQSSLKMPINSKRLTDPLSGDGMSQIDINLDDGLSNSETLSSILKIGYGSYKLLGRAWSNGVAEYFKAKEITSSLYDFKSQESYSSLSTASNRNSLSKGFFLIGLAGDIEDSGSNSPEKSSENQCSNQENLADFSKISRRRIMLEIECKDNESIEGKEYRPNKAPQMSQASLEPMDIQHNKKIESHQVVIYASKPFIFTFLFKSDITDIASPNFYRNLHHQIQQIVKPLLSFTKYRALKPEIVTDSSEAPIFNLIWDPQNLTISSTIPNIPNISKINTSNAEYHPWSGAEALNTHIQIIKAHIACRNSLELERICKTSRGWWIVWTKVPEPLLDCNRMKSQELIFNLNRMANEIKSDVLVKLDVNDDLKETNELASQIDSKNLNSIQDVACCSHSSVRLEKQILLIRKADDHVMARSMNSFSNASIIGSERGWTSAPSTLVQDIGFDTRQYIDQLLNLIS
ncbi:putative vacuolar fusion protein ccz1 protein [Erysiphe necator]|uniref:Putative vacuolar fusion protein ccz1 protein n=1 Tax=Uncinula necator TaxID=52586 RepID=A0A0B1PDI8_UNCNE|nr:putative vacuolar fusion protein ccz1 protein [Erysiphe necator]